MAMKPKAEVIQFRRGASLDDESEIPLASASISVAAAARDRLRVKPHWPAGWVGTLQGKAGTSLWLRWTHRTAPWRHGLVA